MRGLSLIVALARCAGPPAAVRDGWRALRSGRARVARAAALRALDGPLPRERHCGALRLLGDAHLALTSPRNALGAYGRALDLGARDASLHVNAGNALRALGRDQRAVEQYAAACALDPEDAQAHANLGVTRLRLGWAAAAIEPLERAVALRPDYPIAEASLAGALEATNRVTEAARVADRLLERFPDDPSATLVRAILDRRAGDLEAARARLERLVERTPGPEVEAHAWAELGRVLDRLGECDAAFRAACRGQAGLARAPGVSGIDRGAHPALVRRVRAWLPSRPPAPVLPSGAVEVLTSPVFVVGFPRSGTTLVEHVLGALAGVATSDEEPIVDRLVRALPVRLGRPFRYPEDLDTLALHELAALRRDYARAAAARSGRDYRRFVDKNPWNLVHLPFLRLLFPASPLVVVVRDPRDAVLSAFFQDFRPNVGTVQFTELESAARCCAELLGLWLDARPALARPWVEVRYEALVTDFEAEARRLVAAVGERWDPSVSRFHEQAACRVVSTPSREDVGRPVTSRSIGRWRAYGRFLAPVLPRLESLLEPLGYGGGGGPGLGSGEKSPPDRGARLATGEAAARD